MISASVNTDAINRALGLYAQAMKHKTQPYIVNRMLRNVAAHAVRLTGKADAAKIAHLLGQTATGIKFNKKTGKVQKRKTRIISENSMAYRIVRAREAKRGGVKMGTDEAMDKARKLIAARVGAVNFMRSGWVPAFRDLSKLTRGSKAPMIDKSVRVKGSGDKGYAKPANIGQAVTVGEIGNSAQGAAAWPGGRAGLQAAVNHVAADMEAFAIAELAKQGRSSGLDVRAR